MKKILGVVALVAALSCGLAAQDYTTITAANITDASGAKLASGSLCFQGTGAAGNPISYQAGGGGQVIRTPVCFTVTNGAVSAAQVANPALTDPAGVLYHITVTDTTGTVVIDDPLVSLAGSTWSFDAYVPGGPVSTPTPLPLAVGQGGTWLASIIAAGDCLGNVGGVYAGVTCLGGSSGVASFNGRTGAVVPANGDYSFGLLSGRASLGQLPDGCAGCVLLGQGGSTPPAYTADAEVQGLNANGTAATGAPVLMAGDDGTYVRTLKTDASGDLVTVFAAAQPVTQSGAWSFTCASGCYQATQPVSGTIGVSSLPALPAAAATIGAVNQAGAWDVTLNGTPGFNLTELAGTALGAPAPWGTAPSGDVPGVNAYVLDLPAVTQPSGANLHVDIDNLPATQPVSGAVTAMPPTETSVAPQYITAAVTIDAAAGTLDSYQFSDSGTPPCYIEFFNAASANVTLGTTAPIGVVALFPTSSNQFEVNGPSNFHLAFATALSVAAVTAYNGSTGCPASTALLNSAIYR